MSAMSLRIKQPYPDTRLPLKRIQFFTQALSTIIEHNYVVDQSLFIGDRGRKSHDWFGLSCSTFRASGET